MQATLQKVFGQGIFGMGWKHALVSIVLAVGVYFSSKVYALLNHGPAMIDLRTPLDAALPVVPIFVIPYVSLEPVLYGSLILFLILRTRVFQSAALSMVITFWVSYLFYIFLQTQMIRPELAGTDTLTMMIREVYAGDNPFNCFPSLHTSLSTLMAIHWWRFDRRLGIIEGIWSALIVLSTVLVKQHVVADILGGLAVAFGAAWLAWKYIVPWVGKRVEG